MAARGSAKVVSVNGALTVTFTTAAGGTPTVYSDEALTTSISLPATVADGAATTFWFPSPGSYTVSVKTAAGVQIAGDLNATRIITVFPGEVAVLNYDTRLLAKDASGDSGRNSPGTAGNSTYLPKLAALRRFIPGDPAYPSDMATPPTVTLGVANAASAITSAKTWDAGSNGVLTYSGSEMGYGAPFPDNIGYSPIANDTTNNTVGAWVVPPWRVSFYTDAPKFEVYTKGVTTAYRVIVDGAFVTAGGGPTVTRTSDGNGYRDLYDFTSAGGRKIRRVDVDLNASGRLYGILTGPIDTLVPARRKGPRVIVVGDSFTEGTGATAGFMSWSHQLCMLMGVEPWSSGLGGTGYLTTGGAGKTNFRTRLQADVLRNSPDVIVWAGGINDWGSFTASAIATELTACLTAATAALSNVIQIVVGPFWRNGASTMPTGLLDTKDAMKAAALAFGAIWVDPLELLPTPMTYATTLNSGASIGATSVSTVGRPPAGNNGNQLTIEIGTGTTRERQLVTSWSGGGPYTANHKALTYAHSAGEPVTVVGAPIWTGTGRSGALAADGNSDVIVGGSDGTDPTHPTQAGHNVIARTIFGQIALQLPAA